MKSVHPSRSAKRRIGPSRAPHRAALACAAAAALALSACGGGGSDDSSSDGGTFSAGSQDLRYRIAAVTSGDDAASGGDERAYLFGLAGNDTLVAGLGGGALYGDSGDDTLVGRSGADRLMGGKGSDRLFGGPANDMLMGGANDDTLDEGAGHGDLDGGPGNDTLIGGPGADAFAIGPDTGNDVIRDFTAGPGMFDHIAIRDLHWADLGFQDAASGVKISWATGSVLLEGVRMADLAQDDFMFMMSPELPPGLRAPAGPAAERPSPSTEGPATDARVATGNRSTSFAVAGDEQYQVTVGGPTADSLQGVAAWDHQIGRDGDDTLTGGAGDDILEGNAGDDTLVGGAGQDRLDGGPGRDTLMSGDENDEVMGGDGDDVIDAASGHDMIEGGKGNDTITGGPGADAFIVRPDSGNDVVLDFEATGSAQGAFDHLALIDILPGEVTVVDTAQGALVSWDVNGDGSADGSVLLRGVAKADLRQSDFMFNARPGFVSGVSSVGSYYVFPE